MMSHEVRRDLPTAEVARLHAMTRQVFFVFVFVYQVRSLLIGLPLQSVALGLIAIRLWISIAIGRRTDQPVDSNDDSNWWTDGPTVETIHAPGWLEFSHSAFITMVIALLAWMAFARGLWFEAVSAMLVTVLIPLRQRAEVRIWNKWNQKRETQQDSWPAPASALAARG